MINHVKRAKKILNSKGMRGTLAHLLRYSANKVETVKFSRLFNSDNQLGQNYKLVKQEAGSLNASGAVLARTIDDNINPVVAIPANIEINQIVFKSVAIIAHVYYDELMPSILKYLKNIPVQSGLFISTNTAEKRLSIINAIGVDHNFLEVDVRIVPNKGRDIAPKFIAFRDVYAKYPAFLHIHSKKSLHDEDLYAGWRDYLLHSLMGTPEIARSNISILSGHNVGIVYPEHASYIKPVINWGYDFELAKNILSKLDITLDTNNILEFPSGSMFWGRSDAVSKLLSLDLQFDDFPEETGQIDGTLAHAIERSLLYIVESSGFRWHRISTDVSKVTSAQKKQHQFTPLLFSQHDFEKNTSSEMPMRIPVTPCGEGKPRLNLMVPSINSAHIFGGVSTALDIFMELAQTGGFDLRVLITDIVLESELPPSLEGFDLQKIGSETRGEKTVVDCTNRSVNLLEITSKDIFLATIWWTAVNSYRIQEYQKMIYGCAPRVIYLIQDFEPGFYPWSTKYALAESTYHHTEDTVAIFNSEELEKFFSVRYAFPYRCVLPYQPNKNVTKALIPTPRERNILFYARPSASRNCFEVGMEGLRLWSRRNPLQANEWTIYCIGENLPVHSTNGLKNVKSTGKMSLEEYALLLSKSSLGLSLMLSPHPSYPPLEMAYAGLRTITNTYECKDISIRSPNIVSLEYISPESIASAIEEQISELECAIGTITPIHCQIQDIETCAPKYAPDLINEHIWNIPTRISKV